jgi:hypothetical protein
MLQLCILILLPDPLIQSNGQPVDRLSLEQEVEGARRQLAGLNRVSELCVDRASNGLFSLAAWLDSSAVGA